MSHVKSLLIRHVFGVHYKLIKLSQQVLNVLAFSPTHCKFVNGIFIISAGERDRDREGRERDSVIERNRER